MIHFHIITLFREACEPYVHSSMLWRAQKEKKVKFTFYNPRDKSKNKHRKVDDRAYGGGPGMVLAVGPIVDTVRAIQKKSPKKKYATIILSPSGKEFTSSIARSLSKTVTDIILICGHYEGIDARVKKILRAREISIGHYILTGGELPALVIADAVSRQIPGVLGNHESLEETRHASHPVYTRPEIYESGGKKYKVPKILLSGRHADIDKWKRKGSDKK